MADLQSDTAIREDADDLVATLSRDWEIWGPNGGYKSAIALRAAARAMPAGWRPVSFSTQYLSPGAFGDVRLRIETARRGRTAACINVVMSQGDRRVLQAQVWGSDPQSSPPPPAVTPPFPDVPLPDALEPAETVLSPAALASRHRFWNNFDARLNSRLEPGQADPRGARLERWLRFKGFSARRPDGALDVWLDAARSLVVIDTNLWPAHARGVGAPGYVAPNLDLAVWFHEPADEADWLLTEARSDAAGDGLIHATARVWTADRRLVASGGSQMLRLERG
jgi:acyl-CoA thioesterase